MFKKMLRRWLEPSASELGNEIQQAINSEMGKLKPKDNAFENSFESIGSWQTMKLISPRPSPRIYSIEKLADNTFSVVYVNGDCQIGPAESLGRQELIFFAVTAPNIDDLIESDDEVSNLEKV